MKTTFAPATFRILILLGVIAFHLFLLTAMSRRGRKSLWLAAGVLVAFAFILQLLGSLGWFALFREVGQGPIWIFQPISIALSSIAVALIFSIGVQWSRRVVVLSAITAGFTILALTGVSLSWL